MSVVEVFWPVFFPVLAAIISLVHIHAKKYTGPEAVANFLMWQLAVGFGVASIWAGFGNLFLPDRVAESIGWATGSPFQLEVGMWDLAMGVCGLLCLKFKDDFWTAVIIGAGLFFILAGTNHAWDLLVNGNTAPNNAGPVLFIDLFYPLFLAGLLIWYRRGVAAGKTAGL